MSEAQDIRDAFEQLAGLILAEACETEVKQWAKTEEGKRTLQTIAYVDSGNELLSLGTGFRWLREDDAA